LIRSTSTKCEEGQGHGWEGVGAKSRKKGSTNEKKTPGRLNQKKKEKMVITGHNRTKREKKNRGDLLEKKKNSREERKSVSKYVQRPAPPRRRKGGPVVGEYEVTQVKESTYSSRGDRRLETGFPQRSLTKCNPA